MCDRHIRNLRAHGYAVPKRDWSLSDRLHDVGWSVTAAGCWEWNGKRNEHGYGKFTATRLGYRDARAHRVIYRDLYGYPLADDEALRHVACDNPPCVNPAHLQPGSHADNMADMRGRGRYLMAAALCRNKRHDITKPGALYPLGSTHRCVQCRKETIKRENDARKEKKLAWERAKRAASRAARQGR